MKRTISERLIKKLANADEYYREMDWHSFFDLVNTMKFKKHNHANGRFSIGINRLGVVNLDFMSTVNGTLTFLKKHVSDDDLIFISDEHMEHITNDFDISNAEFSFILDALSLNTPPEYSVFSGCNNVWVVLAAGEQVPSWIYTIPPLLDKSLYVCSVYL